MQCVLEQKEMLAVSISPPNARVFALNFAGSLAHYSGVDSLTCHRFVTRAIPGPRML